MDDCLPAQIVMLTGTLLGVLVGFAISYWITHR